MVTFHNIIRINLKIADTTGSGVERKSEIEDNWMNTRRVVKVTFSFNFLSKLKSQIL